MPTPNYNFPQNPYANNYSPVQNNAPKETNWLAWIVGIIIIFIVLFSSIAAYILIKNANSEDEINVNSPENPNHINQTVKTENRTENRNTEDNNISLNQSCYDLCIALGDRSPVGCRTSCSTQTETTNTENPIQQEINNSGSGTNTNASNIPALDYNYSVSTSGLKIIPSPSGIYLGAYNWGGNGISNFENAIGKKVAIAGQTCPRSESLPPFFNKTCMNDWFNRGYIGLFSFEWSPDFSRQAGTNGRYSPQQIINGDADSALSTIAQEIKSFGKPLFFAYQREPQIQPGGGYDGGGYGTNGDLSKNQLSPIEGSFKTNPASYNQYNSPYGTSCNTLGDPMCLDGPERYRDACRHIHDVVESVCKDCVTWVQGAAVGRITNEYKKYYVGDNYVDWHALDVYPWVTTDTTDDPFEKTIETDWSEALSLSNKPVIFVEFGVIKNGKPEGCSTCASTIQDRTIWFNNFFNKVKTSHTQLGAFIYWQTSGGIPFTDYQILSSDADSQAWRTEIQNNPNFWLSNITTA
jgi:hypothetical protein